MGLEPKGLVKPRYLRVSYTGEPEARMVLNALRAAVKSAEDTKSRGIILDLTETDRSLSLEDRILAGSAVAALQSKASRPIPIAILVPGGAIDPEHVGTNAAARRGGCLGAFVDPDEARAWLRTQ